MAPLAVVLSVLLAVSGPARADSVFGVSAFAEVLASAPPAFPEGLRWVKVTEAVGANPNDLTGADYSSLGDVRIIVQLIYRDDGTGELPPHTECSNFYRRIENFVRHTPGVTAWVVGRQPNHPDSWPVDPRTRQKPVLLPSFYADCYTSVYRAIKRTDPDAQVLVAGPAPYAGPFEQGTARGYPHDPLGLNWADYLHETLIEIGRRGIEPDGVALSLHTRGYTSEAFDPGPFVDAGGLTLDFSFGALSDFVQFGFPEQFRHLPIYGVEAHGLTYWEGDGPHRPGEAGYTRGWIPRFYEEIAVWNENAAFSGLPLVLAANLHGWGAQEGWNLKRAAANLPDLGEDWDRAGQFAQAPPRLLARGPLLRTRNEPLANFPQATVRIANVTSASAQRPAVRAIDGSEQTFWKSAPEAGLPHGLTFDLGGETEIIGYRIVHAPGDEGRRTLGLRIETADAEGGPWALDGAIRTAPPGGTPAAATVLEYQRMRTARFVRLIVNEPGLADNNARIAEVVIYVRRQPEGAESEPRTSE